MNKKNIIIWGIFLAVVLLCFGIIYYFTFMVGDRGNLETNSFKKELSQANKDQNNYGEAILTLDRSKCESISEENLKKTCLESIQDLGFYNQALAQLNPDLCKEINNQSKKDACLSVATSSVSYFEKTDPKHLADVYASAHDEKAIAQYEKILKDEPENVKNLLSVSLAYAEKGLKEQEQGRDQVPYVKKALASLEKARTLKPNNSEVYRIEGYAYEILPDYIKSRTSYNKSIELDSNNALAYAGKGHLARLLGLLTEAIEDFNKAAQIDTEKKITSIYVNLCNLELSRGNSDEALRNCKIIIESKNIDMDSVVKSEAYQILASAYIQKHKFEEAKSQLSLARAITPNDPNIFVVLSEVNATQADYIEAEKNARRAVALAPKKAGAYLVLSQSLGFQEKYKESTETAEKGVILVKDDVSLLASSKPVVESNFYNTIAANYKRQGNAEKQAEYEQKANEVLNKAKK